MHTVHNEQYQLTVSSMCLFFCRCSSTLLIRPDCFFSCSLVTQGNKPGKFIHSSRLDGPSLSSVNTFPHFLYRFITTLLTSTNGGGRWERKSWRNPTVTGVPEDSYKVPIVCLHGIDHIYCTTTACILLCS